jgi:MOSC domain-containing protein YiiM
VSVGRQVIAVCAGTAHGPCKPVRERIELVAGLGVTGDAHFGRTVQHRSRARAHPDWENLRQVHLIGGELLDELSGRGLPVTAGEMGENVLTAGVDLLALPTGTVLRLGSEAEVELTGLRNPCRQLDGVRPGLMAAVLDRTDDGRLRRRAGVMAVVRTSGHVRPGDPITVDVPDVNRPLRPV